MSDLSGIFGGSSSLASAGALAGLLATSSNAPASNTATDVLGGSSSLSNLSALSALTGNSSNLADTAALVVATLDLLLVEDVIGAIRAADAGAQASQSSALTPLPTLEAAGPVHSEPVILTREIVHRIVCYEPCFRRDTPQEPPLHVLPRLALEPVTAREAGAVCEAPRVHPNELPIQPPWAVMPWNQPAASPIQVKVVVHRTDIVSKGSLIDIFV